MARDGLLPRQVRRSSIGHALGLGVWSYAGMATLKDLTERIRSATEFDPEVGTTIKLDLKGEGFVHICGSTVTNDDAPAERRASQGTCHRLRIYSITCVRAPPSTSSTTMRVGS